MPHSLFELNSMSRDQLIGLANQLKIKVGKKMTEEEIAYEILDVDARADSVKPDES